MSGPFWQNEPKGAETKLGSRTLNEKIRHSGLCEVKARW